jgi:hypothetical protein
LYVNSANNPVFRFSNEVGNKIFQAENFGSIAAEFGVYRHPTFSNPTSINPPAVKILPNANTVEMYDNTGTKTISFDLQNGGINSTTLSGASGYIGTLTTNSLSGSTGYIGTLTTNSLSGSTGIIESLTTTTINNFYPAGSKWVTMSTTGKALSESNVYRFGNEFSMITGGNIVPSATGTLTATGHAWKIDIPLSISIGSTFICDATLDFVNNGSTVLSYIFNVAGQSAGGGVSRQFINFNGIVTGNLQNAFFRITMNSSGANNLCTLQNTQMQVYNIN